MPYILHMPHVYTWYDLLLLPQVVRSLCLGVLRVCGGGHVGVDIADVLGGDGVVSCWFELEIGWLLVIDGRWWCRACVCVRSLYRVFFLPRERILAGRICVVPCPQKHHRRALHLFCKRRYPRFDDVGYGEHGLTTC